MSGTWNLKVMKFSLNFKNVYFPLILASLMISKVKSVEISSKIVYLESGWSSWCVRYFKIL